MDIKVLGAGCANCQRLYEVTVQAMQQAGLSATISKVESQAEIAAFRVIMTPALVVNGKVRSAGRIPGVAEITTWLTSAAMEEA
jgi:small redox-active disulfide protein 2